MGDREKRIEDARRKARSTFAQKSQNPPPSGAPASIRDITRISSLDSPIEERKSVPSSNIKRERSISPSKYLAMEKRLRMVEAEQELFRAEWKGFLSAKSSTFIPSASKGKVRTVHSGITAPFELVLGISEEPLISDSPVQLSTATAVAPVIMDHDLIKHDETGVEVPSSPLFVPSGSSSPVLSGSIPPLVVARVAAKISENTSSLYKSLDHSYTADKPLPSDDHEGTVIVPYTSRMIPLKVSVSHGRIVSLDESVSRLIVYQLPRAFIDAVVKQSYTGDNVTYYLIKAGDTIGCFTDWNVAETYITGVSRVVHRKHRSYNGMQKYLHNVIPTERYGADSSTFLWPIEVAEGD